MYIWVFHWWSVYNVAESSVTQWKGKFRSRSEPSDWNIRLSFFQFPHFIYNFLLVCVSEHIYCILKVCYGVVLHEFQC